MTPTWLARLFAGRLHYAWVVLSLVFVSMLAGVSVRAAPGVMIGPLRRAFGWDVSTISGAISVNIMLMGLIGPFMAGLMQSLGLKRTMILALLVLMSGTGLSMFMTSPWQLFLTWGVMVGIGSGAGAVGFAGAVANRWFLKRTGFAAGLLFAANAAGQLIFLPLLAWMANRYGWQGVAIGTTAAIACVIPLLFFLLPELPAAIGLAPYGGTTIVSAGDNHAPGSNMFSVATRALDPSLPIDGLLAAVRDVRDLRVVHQRPDQHAFDFLLPGRGHSGNSAAPRSWPASGCSACSARWHRVGCATDTVRGSCCSGITACAACRWC